jgi:hypothetical protein
MDALAPLAGVLRYGNVRQTDTAMLARVIDGLAARIFIGLPGACTGLNDDAAGEMLERMIRTNDAVNRLEDQHYHQDWLETLEKLLDLSSIHGLISGRACRILLDSGQMAREEAGRRLGLGLSTALDPGQAAAWVEGFLRGSAQLLIHDNGLLSLIDAWLNSLPGEIFPRLLPLLRRTFSTFAPPERRSIGEQIRRGKSPAVSQTAMPGQPADFDQASADAVLPLALLLLGIPKPAGGRAGFAEERTNP